MIGHHQFVAALVAELTTALDGVTVAEQLPPDPLPARTVIVSTPAGSGRYGGVTCPADHSTVRVDLRTVTTGRDAALVSRECMRLATVATSAAIATRLTGDGWASAGWSLVGDSGVEHEASHRGATANNVTTIEFTLSA